MTTPFRENVRSYCYRVRSDCRQIEYLSDLITVSDKLHIGGHIQDIRNYLAKLEETLVLLEKMNEQQGENFDQTK